MKILIITPSYKPAFIYGGPIFSVGYLAEELTKNNEVLVLSTTANGKEELTFKSNSLQNIDGVNVRFFNRQTKDHSHLSIGLLKYLWNNGNHYDVIHIQSWWNLVAIFSALICRIRNWKYVITPRGMLSPYTYQSSFIKKTIHLFIGNHLLKNCRIQATTKDEAVKIEMLNPTYKTAVIPNFVNLKTPVINRTKQEVVQLLFLSRIHPKKGLDVLLLSLPLLKFKFRLHIVGDGDTEYIESLKELSEKLKIEDKIIWHGSVYGDKKFELYSGSDFMILPSHDENFANNVLESLLMGTPVLISKNVGLANFVFENKLGFIFSGDETKLAECLNEAYANNEFINNININARKIVLDEFENNKVVNDYISLYREIKK